MKVVLEEINPDANSSFHLLLTPHLSEVFLWHYHPEYEIVYIEGASGTRHVGDHISRYEGSDLVFIGPNIPHLNFDYGVQTEHQKVVVQLKQNFLGDTLWQAPEFNAITGLFERARSGVSFYGQTKQEVGEQLKQLAQLPPFERLMKLLAIFQQLATSTEWTSLQGEAVTNAYNLTEQLRLKKVNQFIAEQYGRKIEVDEAAAVANLTKAAFCRYFKRMTHLTFTQFLNQYRVNQAQKLLLVDRTVSEACFACGFDSLSYFTKIFRRVTGENPLQFKKRHRS
ncbi:MULTISPECIES: helix-turn-helix transcriptional regulator [unclassified Spirosoma]|uniref:AraC family transcriptional regulator n=1 Tax=unclassified Spirosoma TaxID=2621999 RepID=UPI00096207BE|nr:MULTISPECIES: AraC family transcriptional regulator [unclassified Spirosoma]MBN8825885.1 helix-turn-helix domain-containing protein [Spirosoma sp.]OJW70574.1 MAG: AraC family transcriptional regulator [Spirosoma sp. 48-14]